MQRKEEIRRIACKWGRHAVVMFLSVMAVLTLLSRVVDSYVIPQAAVCTLEEMQLSYEWKVEGRVRTKGRRALYCQENLRIENVWVQENDIVQKGDLLFTLDRKDLQTKIARMEEEIHKYDLQIADMEHASQMQADPQSFQADQAAEGDSNILIVTPDQANVAKAGNFDMISSSAGAENSNAADIQRLEKKQAQESLQQLYLLREAKGQVCAQFAGGIFTCAISTGSLTSAEPVLIVEDFRQPFQFEGIVGGNGYSYAGADAAGEEDSLAMNESGAGGNLSLAGAGSPNLNMRGNQDFPVEEGLEGTLEMGDGDVVLEGVKISKVAEGEEGTYRVTAELADGSVSRTGNAVLRFTKESRRYRKCVPRSALHEERSGYYVMVVKEEKTVLGIKPVAQYVPVTLIEHNDEYAAVEGNISEDDKMIVDTNKEIKEGKRVRIVEEWS